jgi:hypothetical protein
MKTRIILSITMVFLIYSCETRIKDENSKALTAIINCIEDEYFVNGWNIEKIDFKINNMRAVRFDSLVLELTKVKLWQIAFKMGYNSSSDYRDSLGIERNRQIIDFAGDSKELDEYLSKLKKFSKMKKVYVADVYCKFTAIQTNSSEKSNILWKNSRFILGEDFSIVEPPKMFKD